MVGEVPDLVIPTTPEGLARSSAALRVSAPVPSGDRPSPVTLCPGM
ncbi:hypothetical protein KCH_52440 [Kitasatospora cheerisanensis KCTC 2395]|uniref:Uncharacterized protein n=1 Tax=Kitasatospora cheerisanensis KCTC 2395 TaxID=1348663 RepID=A0A066YNL7_9ACTN|nr:hypothetical protein KCH_52440 [Kitasatospora cheerisanensis KCTC 2395]